MATPQENGPKRRLIFLAYSFFGLVAMACGLMGVLYCYAFATMVDPSLEGSAYWQAVLKGMFFTPMIVNTFVGLILALGGAVVAIWTAAVAVGLIATAPTRRTLVAIAVGLLAVLLIGGVVAALS